LEQTETKMKIGGRYKSKSRLSGFSLIEVMVVIGIISIVVGAILTQVNQLQQRATAEQGKVDDFQQARDFLDQIFRDSRQMGYPNIRNFDTTVAPFTTTSTSCTSTTWQATKANDCRIAVGLVKITPTMLEFEGDVDGSGTVSVVSYALNGSGACSTCLQRAQVAKVNGDNVTAQSNLTSSSYTVEVQNVQNTSGTPPIFSAYDSSGNAVTIGTGIDMDNNAATIAGIRTIEVKLSIASATAIDPKTGQQIEADIGGRVQVVNCSMATTGLTSSTGLQLTCQ
jgi:prepilin-type N-terminal cleavage/methylation domain-containing protein